MSIQTRKECLIRLGSYLVDLDSPEIKEIKRIAEVENRRPRYLAVNRGLTKRQVAARRAVLLLGTTPASGSSRTLEVTLSTQVHLSQ